MVEHTKRQVHKKFYNMRCLVMFITAVCLLFLLKLKWPKRETIGGQRSMGVLESGDGIINISLMKLLPDSRVHLFKG